jgi:ATP-dependent Lon protease
MLHFLEQFVDNDEDMEFMPLVSIDDEDANPDNEQPEYNEEIPILSLRNTVLFPGVVIPITVGREKSIKAVKEAYKKDKYIGIVSQKNSDIEDPEPNDLFKVGTIARIVKLLKMPDGGTTILIHGRDKFTIENYTSTEPFIKANFSVFPAQKIPKTREFKALITSMKDLSMQIIDLASNIPPEMAMMLKNMDNPEFMLHFISSNLNITIEEKQELLEIDDITERIQQVLNHLATELQVAQIKNEVQNKARHDMDKQQRDYYLQQQLKTIQEELGTNENGTDTNDLLDKAKKKQWTKESKEAFDREFIRLQRMNPMMPDYSTTLNYLELLLDLPWHEYTKDNFDLNRAQKVLDKDHYGLDKIKQRIIEHLAVLKLKNDMKAPILCFVGPPGVGKTSLGKSIAKALKRQYARMSLGGLHDESEIRGHRRTYIGSMPGRIIQLLKKAKSSNPVIILDEIDKVGSDFRGDPASALLEVLDPEQNTTFHDNYLEVEYDLSKVMFIATANTLSTIHPALLDRMEIIHVSGYSLEEKLSIAKQHLIPKQLAEHALKSKHIKLTDAILSKLISEYTRESGVRTLERRIAALMRGIAKSVAMEEEYNPKITPKDVERILGLRRHDTEMYTNDNPPGVAVGLAWTETGGDILFIETSLSKGKGGLTLTGNLGDVMKESATTALSYIRAHAQQLGIDIDVFETTNIHLHVPEGGIPKDGPSAGITMLTTLVSALTNRKVKPFMAMTGEITLRGKVLPVGGIKEKVLAAKRAGIKEIILCQANQRDVEEINAEYTKGLAFTYVKDMIQVYNLALV